MPSSPEKNKSKAGSLAFWGVTGLALFMLFNTVSGGNSVPEQEVLRSEFAGAVKNTKNPEVDFSYGYDGSVKAKLRDPAVQRVEKDAFSSFRAGETKPSHEITTHVLREQGDAFEKELKAGNPDVKTRFVAKKEPGTDWFMTGLMVAPGLFIAYFLYKQLQGMRGGAGGASAFGKSKAKMLTEDKRKTNFADVAGADHAKEDLKDVIEFMKDPEKFQRLGAKSPKGTLLVGPPGTGKTLLARAMAGEAGVPFFSISGSDFVEMFVGVGASRVRDMFEECRKNAPCILFIDEIDAVGKTRNNPNSGTGQEHEQTLNQLLVEMDGFDNSSGVIIVAATNRPDTLDPALLRPGRFDRQVTVDRPDFKGREAILKVHVRNKPLAPDVNLAKLAKGTPGFGGADLENLANEAALRAVKKGASVITMAHFEEAKDKILMGDPRSLLMTDAEKRLTAYHEAGHALIGFKVPGNDPVHKMSILPRGRALGVTISLPETDRVSMSKAQLKANLAMLYGGRIAEEMIVGEEGVTTGAQNDIERASDLARKMVKEWGLSEKLGPQNFSAGEAGFLGGAFRTFSEDTLKAIDKEVSDILAEARSLAQKTLHDNRADLDGLANAVIKYETIEREEMIAVLEGRDIVREDDSAPKQEPVQNPAANGGMSPPQPTVH